MKGLHHYYCPLIFGLIMANPSHATSHTNLKTDRGLAVVQQQNTITGTATYNNMPLSGVMIVVKGKNTTTTTTENGTFSIPANPTDTLIFTYIGFKTLEIPINNKTNIAAAMEEDATALQQVTVNTGYYTVKESERTGSIAKINSKDIEKQPVTNILGTMQGNMAGVSVTQETGIAGGGYNISIRGANSLRINGNEPLYIIDGVPYATDPISHAQTSLSIPGDGNPLGSLNPNDVESIEILT